MTSSLRNSLHRRNHKERGQLAHRKKFGLLEKHKDYAKRARDYHSKQDRLTRLKQKAAERNKDEFYFSMTKEKTRGGVHIKDRGNVALPTDMVKVLKTQDENYIRTMRAVGLKKIDKLKAQLTAMTNLVRSGSGVGFDNLDDLTEQDVRTLVEAGIFPPKLHLTSKKRKPGHIIFAENKEQVPQLALATSTPTIATSLTSAPLIPAPVDLGWKSETVKISKKHMASIKSGSVKKNDGVEASNDHSYRSKLLKELSARLVRDRQFRNTQREFEMQRFMLGKGGRQKISAVEKNDEEDEGEDEDEDELDARKGKLRLKKSFNDEVYKPRVYKWRLERKK